MHLQSVHFPLNPVRQMPPVAANDPNLAPAKPQLSLDAGTVVQTSFGVQKVSSLSVGDHVLTRSGTLQPITRIDNRTVTKEQIQDDASLAPVRFDPGALPGMPDGPATLVSPDCPIVWGADASDLNDFPARAFCDGGMIRRVIPDGGIHYIRLHFDTTQQICVGGIWVQLDADARTLDAPAQAPVLVHEIRIFRPLHV